MTPKSAPPVKKNAFVHKLYSMLKNPKLSKLIWWTGPDDSNTFALYPSKEFADVLSEYFKHGNVASFVRQLHMYGFHKISDPQSAYHDKESPVWEFRHSSGKFKKNDESSLVYIKRRSSSNASRNSSLLENENQPPHPHNQAHQTHPHPSELHDHPVVYYPPPRQQSGPAYAYYGPVAPTQWSQHPAYHTHPVQHHPHHQPYPYQPQMYTAPYQPAPPHPQGQPAPHGLPQAAYATPMLPPPQLLPNDSKSTPTIPPRTASDSPSPKRRSLDAVRPPVSPSLSTSPHLRYSHSTSSLPTYPPTTSQQPPRSTPSISEDAALQFRRPWEAANAEKRPRHPSMFFDPLAPNAHSHPHAQRPDAIKLPPLVPPQTGSPQIGQLGTPVPVTTGNSIGNQPQAQSQSQPSPAGQIPISRNSTSSVQIRKSVYDKLRPSLIELHSASLTATSSGSISTPTRTLSGHNFDSIGSTSSSVFSGASSISSLSSGTRSSFGSISYLIEDSRKASLVEPHERPNSPLSHPRRATSTIAEVSERDSVDSNPTEMPEKVDPPRRVSVSEPTEERGSAATSSAAPSLKGKVAYLLDDSNANSNVNLSNGSSKRQKVVAEAESDGAENA